jgi:anti-sigma factor RsiW
MTELSKHKQAMHRALDQEITAEEQAELEAHLTESQEDSVHWERLRQVDDTLHKTPKVAPSPNFTGRVMAAVAALHAGEFVPQRIGLGIALGLMIAAFLTLPALAVALVVLVGLLTDPGAINALFQLAADGASYVVGAVSSLEVSFTAGDIPLVLGLGSGVLSLVVLWWWSVRHLGQRTGTKETS